MSNRITQKQLESLVNHINEITNSPKFSYSRNKQGELKANIGNYYLDGAYGGWKLVRVVSDGGGITEITQGFLPKRELFNLMHAYIDGIKIEGMSDEDC